MQGKGEAYGRFLTDILAEDTVIIKIHTDTKKVTIRQRVRQGYTMSLSLCKACR